MSDTSRPGGPTGLDTSVAHPARRYDYLLGGKDNFEADRKSGDDLVAANPAVRTAAVENRAFMRRFVRYCATEYGVDQFLDVGTGIPTRPNTHEVAQRVIPTAKIVYVDNDPLVGIHARALMVGDPRGETAYVEADLRDPARILDHPDLRGTLDLDRPVALMLFAVLHFIPDSDDVSAILTTLTAALAPGSVLAVSHGTDDFSTPDQRAALRAELNRKQEHGESRLRSRDEIAELFAGVGWDLLEPGIVPIVAWHPELDPKPRYSAADSLCWGAVARRP